VQLLLEKGANIDAEGGDWQTALHLAAYSQQEAVAQLLRKGLTSPKRVRMG